jgi:hypothetical protein
MRGQNDYKIAYVYVLFQRDVLLSVSSVPQQLQCQQRQRRLLPKQYQVDYGFGFGFDSCVGQDCTKQIGGVGKVGHDWLIG